ncbi:MAG TPA: hypothetical protein VNX00_12490 [Herbaspirillum sp.]|nr:hypothetical protein [Herbaspirillum sp.]
MSVYEKVKAEMARRTLEMEQELETRRRTFDMIFAKIVPRLENYFNKECDSLIRDGGRANVKSELESPLRSTTTFSFVLPYDGSDMVPPHTYAVTVEADRFCTAEGKLFEKRSNAQPEGESTGPTLREALGSIDAPDFLIKLDKSFAKLIELAMSAK